MRIDRAILNQVARLKLATPGLAAGRMHGDRCSPFIGRGIEFADYRPYAPGDDLRLVDWNVYERLEQILVRLFHEDRNLSVQICVDASASMGFGEPRKADHAAELAAALALVSLLKRDSVTLGCAGGEGPKTIVKGQNQNAIAKILKFLEMVEPDGIDDPMRALKAQVRGSRPDRLFYISDMLKEDKEIDRLLRVVAASARRPVLLHVLSEEELSPDFQHPKRIIDSETGEEMRIAGGRLSERAYREALDAYLESIRRECRALQIQYVMAPTATRVPELLNSVLRHARVVESASGASR
jgi:uncharacterized protein (DUF58 family)